MTKYFLAFLFLILGIGLHSQPSTSLQVFNPQNWQQGNSTIEEAQFTVHPRGVYLEVGMYLTFSARGTKYEKNTGEIVNLEQSLDNLEAILRFSLPRGSMVTDSWLWVNEDIMQAAIEERWRARLIYQSIVGARLDPSLLVKNNTNFWDEGEGDDYYNIRIFPLQPDSTRRIKITYLTPGDWKNGQVSTALPVEILQASRLPVEKIAIQCFFQNEFANPKIDQLPNQNFSLATHESLGDFLDFQIDHESIQNGLNVSYTVPMKNGVFLSTYQSPEKDYYQLVLKPEEILLDGVTSPRKVAVLIDYDTSSTTFTKTFLLENLKEKLIEELRPQDQFNLLFTSESGLQSISSQWVKADFFNIEIMFNLLEEGFVLSEKSNFHELLKAGVEFIQTHENEGDILLLSCNGQYYGQERVDAYYKDTLMAEINGTIPTIQVADYQNKNQKSKFYEVIGENGQWLRDKRYYGNEYLYSLLRKETGGNIHTIRFEKSLGTLLQKSLEGINLIDGFSEIKIGKENGSCFNEYKLAQPEFSSLNANHIEVGKCIGDFPFKIEVSGKINGETVTRSITIDESEVNNGAVDHVTTWAGSFIAELEKNKLYTGLTQRIMEKVIELSKEYRVLSLWTAFLALEEDLGGYVCEECIDETDPLQIVDIGNSSTQNNSENEVELPNITFGELRSGSPFVPPVGDSIITATKDILINDAFQIVVSPNPFKVGTTIELNLKEKVSLDYFSGEIFNMFGQKIKAFPPTKITGNGSYQFYWDGTGVNQEKLPAGIYLFVLQAENYHQSHKLVLH